MGAMRSAAGGATTRARGQPCRRDLLALCRSSIRAHVVLLADLHAVVAQQVVRRGDMEEELRQPVREQVGLAADAAFLRGARAQHDLALLTAFEPRRVQATD